jgi:hypothetical protein
MIRFMPNEQMRATLGQHARSVPQRFDVATVMGKWERLVDVDAVGCSD